jgi:hypothetical protein
MGQVIQDVDTSNFAPTAQLKEAGATLTSIVRGKREIKTKFGPKMVYMMEAVDATCKFRRGNEEVFPQAGEKVEVMPATRLERQLNQVPVGSKVLIKYLGIGKSTRGNPPHLYHVEVL